MKKSILTILFTGFVIMSCNPSMNITRDNSIVSVRTGLDVLFNIYLDELKEKNIALVTNHSGLNSEGKTNVSMFLSYSDINLVKIFTPEHGFTGTYADGQNIINETTSEEIPQIISLYGDSRKPTPEMLQGIDLIIYDIQDVGARFYTYISTLGLIMEAAGNAKIPVMVLDRPNPIGNKVEGPILSENYKSFVGKYPIPIRYGLTVGELAQMIVGEQMIDPICDIIIIPMENYKRYYLYNETNLPWVNPSPNIIDLETAFVYPGLCLLQGTNVSDGRGTYNPIKRIGAPWINSEELTTALNRENLKGVNFTESSFIPIVIPTMATAPKFQNRKCFGTDIHITDPIIFNSVETGLTILNNLYKLYPDSFKIFSESMARLWGSDSIEDFIFSGSSPTEIIKSYQKDLNDFIELRKKYLIYY